MTLSMKSAAIAHVTTAQAIIFGDYEKVTGAVVGLRGPSLTVVATKVTISTNVVTVTPASTLTTITDAYYDIIADCI